MLNKRKTKKRNEKPNKRVDYKIGINGEWESVQESLKPLTGNVKKDFKEPRPKRNY